MADSIEHVPHSSLISEYTPDGEPIFLEDSMITKKPKKPKERLVIVTHRIALHLPPNTDDDSVNDYLEEIGLGHCGWEDSKNASNADDEKWPRLGEFCDD